MLVGLDPDRLEARGRSDLVVRGRHPLGHAHPPRVEDELVHLGDMMASSRTCTQWYRRSDRSGIMNFFGSERTRASRSSLGNPKPITVSSRGKAT
jgi:hypothetical protein